MKSTHCRCWGNSQRNAGQRENTKRGRRLRRRSSYLASSQAVFSSLSSFFLVPAMTFPGTYSCAGSVLGLMEAKLQNATSGFFELDLSKNHSSVKWLP